MKKYNITDIQWDTDGESVDLPTEVVADIDLTDEYLSHYNEDGKATIIEDEISDWLSDTYGFCHLGFRYEEVR